MSAIITSSIFERSSKETRQFVDIMAVYSAAGPGSKRHQFRSDCEWPKRVLSARALKSRAESEQTVDRHQHSASILGLWLLAAVSYLRHHLSFTETTCSYTGA